MWYNGGDSETRTHNHKILSFVALPISIHPRMKRNYRNYTNEDIVKYAKQTYSIAGLLRLLGLRPVGGNYYTLKRRLQQLSVDTRHWTRQGWNKGQRLLDWSDYNRARNVKPHLIKLRGHKCEGNCKRKTWNKFPVPLEIHHEDGVRTNNNLENLKLLCPNCHAQTSTWRNRKRL